MGLPTVGPAPSAPRGPPGPSVHQAPRTTVTHARVERRASYCRLCPAACGVLLDIEDGRITRVLGDPSHPISKGYTCPKGRRGADLANSPDRLRTTVRRSGDTHVPVDYPAAVSDIAARLEQIIADHGPDSVGLFMGTQQNFAALTAPSVRSWFRELGSTKLFSTMTIDQSAKWIVQERMGTYLGGRQRFEDADVWLLVGTNTLVSANGGDGDGAVAHNPAATIRDARRRGLTLIVIDPRRTETAEVADIHLAPRPGTDAVLFLGIIASILREGLHDRDFCDRYVSDLDQLASAVSHVSPAVVERVCGVSPEELAEVAHAFAEADRGMATSGTGLCMGPHSNLAEHLVATLNVICGRYLREGEPADDRAVLAPRTSPRAEVSPPQRGFETGSQSRIDGVRATRGELPSNILADEILEPGPDRIRALFVSGGNPLLALPDREKAQRALSSLDLLVCVDPFMSHTAELADYVIAPTTMYERSDHTILMEAFFPARFGQHTPPILEAPPEAVDDWRFFFDLATASGRRFKFAGRFLDPLDPPSSEQALDMLAERGPVSMEDIRAGDSGYLAGPAGTLVGPPRPGAESHRLTLLPPDVHDEIRAALADRVEVPGFPYRLTVRRTKQAMNSVGTRLPGLVPEGANPAHLNPGTMAALHLADGDPVEIRSAAGRLTTTALADRSVPAEVVSMSHCYGRLRDEPGPGRRPGPANVNELTGNVIGLQSINAMPTMTAVPVSVHPVDARTCAPNL